MPANLKNTDPPPPNLERLRHSMPLLILLDLVTLGFYSALRIYPVHAELSRARGRRIFPMAFLHVLIMFHLLLWVLRISRGQLAPDATILALRLGSSLLFISLILVFRRFLQKTWRLSVAPWPLAVWGFWYLQQGINRVRQTPEKTAARDSWLSLSTVIVVNVVIAMTLAAFRIIPVANASMEPTLFPGDLVIVNQLAGGARGQLQRGALVAYQSPHNRGSIHIKRLIGLPGDRLHFYGDSIAVNDQPLPCEGSVRMQPGTATFDDRSKRLFTCRMGRRSFPLQRYQEGPLTEVNGMFEVPPRHYFVIGDNLDNSLDSRVIGAIRDDYILGSAWLAASSHHRDDGIAWNRWLRRL